MERAGSLDPVLFFTALYLSFSHSYILTAEQITTKGVESLYKDIDILAAATALDMDMQRRSSKRVSILCPCHDDKNHGSCYLDTETNRFYCFSCHKGGDAIDMVRYVKKCSFAEAVKFLSKELNIKLGNGYKKRIPLTREQREELFGKFPRSKALYLREYGTGPYMDENGDRYDVALIDEDPLYTLYIEEPNSFYEMIRDKATERLLTLVNLYLVACECPGPEHYRKSMAEKFCGFYNKYKPFLEFPTT